MAWEVVFRERDIDNFASMHTVDSKQLKEVKKALMGSPELMTMGEDEAGEKLYTTRTMLQSEKQMLTRAEELNTSSTHDVDSTILHQTIASHTMTREQEEGFRHLTQGEDIAVLIGGGEGRHG